MAAWVLRDTVSTKAQGSDNRPLVALLAAFPIFLLSMVVTVFLATRYSIDNAVAFGVLGAVFVVLLDLFLVVCLVGLKLWEGQFAAAVQGGLLLIGLGLLIVPVAAVVPWSISWLIGWILDSNPWVPVLLRDHVWVWGFMMLILRALIVRKQRRGGGSTTGSA